MIQIETAFTNPALPDGRTAREIILDSADLRSWWQVDPDSVTLVSGLISALAPIGGASAAVLAQTDAAKRPTFADGALAARFPLANFDGTNDALEVTPAPHTATAAWSWVWCGVPVSAGADQALVTHRVSTGDGTRLRINSAGGVDLQHGNGTVAVAGALTWGQPALIIAQSTGSLIQLEVNGQRAAATATNNVTTATTLRVGVTSSGGAEPSPSDLSDLLIWQRAILGDAELLAAIYAMAAVEYGVEGV